MNRQISFQQTRRDTTRCVSTSGGSRQPLRGLQTGLLVLCVILSACLTPRAVQAQSGTGEAIFFFPYTEDIPVRAYSAQWTEPNEPVQHCQVLRPQTVTVRTPDGTATAAKQIGNLDDASGCGAEFYHLAMGILPSYAKYNNLVYPMVMFANRSDYEAFWKDKSGALDWAGLKNNAAADYSLGSAFSYEPDRQRFSPFGSDYKMLQTKWSSGSDYFMVVEALPYKKGAVTMKTKWLTPFDTWGTHFLTTSATGSSSNPLVADIAVTYTNSAPYPVLVEVFQPMVDAATSTFANMPGGNSIAPYYRKKGYQGTAQKKFGWEFVRRTLYEGEGTGGTQLSTLYDDWPYTALPKVYSLTPESEGRSDLREYQKHAFYPMVLMPHEKKTLTWSLYIVSHFDHRDEDRTFQSMVVAPDRKSLLGITTPAIVYTVTPEMMVQDKPELVETLTKVSVPGRFDGEFGVTGGSPSAFKTTDNTKKFSFKIFNKDQLDKIIVEEIRTGTVAQVNSSDITINSSGEGSANLNTIIGTSAGNYQISFYETGKTDPYISYRFYTSPYVGVFNASATSLLKITQKPDGKFKLYSWGFASMEDDETELLSIATQKAAFDGTKWEIDATAVINDVLTTDGTNGLTLTFAADGSQVEITPRNNAILYHTGSNGYNNTNGGLGNRLTPTNGSWRITLTDTKLYNNQAQQITDGRQESLDENGEEYDDDWIAPEITYTDLIDLNIFGDKALANLKNPKIYGNQLSLSGSMSLAALTSTVLEEYLKAELDVYDIRLGATRNFLGARGDLDAKLGAALPFGIFDFTGAAVTGYMNTLPENEWKHFGLEGEIGIHAGLDIALFGKLEFANMNENTSVGGGAMQGQSWMLNSIYGELQAPLNIPPCPIVQISNLGAGVSGLAESFHAGNLLASGKSSIPTFSVSGTLGLALGDDDLLGASGKATVGLSEISLTEGSLTLLTQELLEDVHCRMTLSNLGTGWSYNTGGSTIPIPLVKLKYDLGGKLNLFDIIVGSVEGNMSVDFGRLSQHWPQPEYLAKAIAEKLHEGNYNLNSLYVTDYYNRKVYVKDAIWDLIDYGLLGQVDVQVPAGLPYAGYRFASVNGSLDKIKAMVSAEGKIGGEVTFGGHTSYIGFTIEAWIAYYFNGKGRGEWKGDIDIRSSAMPVAGAPLRDQLYTLSATGSDGLSRDIRYNSPTFIPMTKNSEAGGGVTTRAFSGSYANTHTQTMQDIPLAKGFTVGMRSRSNTTGLKLTCTSGDLNGLVAKFTATDIDWQQSEDGTYYFATIGLPIPTVASHIENGTLTVSHFTGKTLEGDWKMEAYDANVTNFDAAGLIDCDFFYLVNPASINSFSYSYDSNPNNVTWTNADVADDQTYRVRFELVNASDATQVYPMGETAEWPGNAPQTAFTLTKDSLEGISMLPGGSYFLRATIEKKDLVYTLDAADANDPDAMQHVSWMFQDSTKTAAFVHVNPEQPAYGVTGLAAAPVNGEALIEWTAPSDMTNVDGYHLYVRDADTDTLVLQLEAHKDATQMTVSAGEVGSHLLPYSYGYKVTVAPYHQFENIIVNDPMDVSLNDTLNTRLNGPEATASFNMTRPNRPDVRTLHKVTTATSEETLIFDNNVQQLAYPADFRNIPISIRTDQALLVGIVSGSPMDAASVQISEEMNAFADAHATGGDPTFSPISTTTFTPNASVAIPFTGITDGIYLLECTLKNGVDYNVYTFTVHVDNLPPLLMASDTTLTDGSREISGSTEPDAVFTFNGDTIDLSQSGTFARNIGKDVLLVSLMSTDKAGNIGILDMDFGSVPQLPSTDITDSLAIDFDEAQVLLSDNSFIATAKVRRSGVLDYLPTAEAGNLQWSVLQGGDVLDINPSTGVITPKQAGNAIIQASYLDVLFDVASVAVADRFPVSDLFVSNISPDKKTLTLEFTEPTGATAKTLYYSAEEPVGGVVSGGWVEVTSATFNGNGQVTATILEADKDRTLYFRLEVTGGVNAGYSNTAGRHGASAVTPIYTVTFTADGMAATTQDVVVGDLLTRPADPVRSGYTFNGWYREASFATLWDFATMPVTADMTLYGKWTETVTPPTPPVIHRRVTLDVSPHFASNPAPGAFYVESTHNLVITLTPLATLPEGYEPQVTTDRTSIPDDQGGVKVTRNDDGTYTVLIAYIQQGMTITITAVLPVANEHIAGARVWSYGNRLYIATGATDGRAHIYNVAGSLVKILPYAAGETVGATLPAGVYVVAAEGRRYRVAVK